jgi:uncharacterized glyoxalase superfamily protein PhnB
MKPTPIDWPRLSSSIYYRDAARMIDWLVDAFGFKVRIRVDGEDGRIEHSELEYGEALVMVCSEKAPDGKVFSMPGKSAITAGVNTQSLMLFVDDVDAHCTHARSCGAIITSEPQIHDYGEDYWADRSYGALDPEQHMWWFTQRVRDQKR